MGHENCRYNFQSRIVVLDEAMQLEISVLVAHENHFMAFSRPFHGIFTNLWLKVIRGVFLNEIFINLQEQDIARITADPKLVKLWSWICRIL